MRELTIAVYLLCLVAALALELLARRPRRDPEQPRRLSALGAMLDALLARRAPRIALIVFWWWLGWHFLVVRTVDPPLG